MNVLERLNYNDLFAFEISCSKAELLGRIQDSLEVNKSSLSAACTINIAVSENANRITRDRNFPFASIKRNKSVSRTLLFKRYNTPVRTIANPKDGLYEVHSHLANDENAALYSLRDFLWRNEKTASYPWFYSSLVDLEGNGVLIAGETKQGKTSLCTHLCLNQNAQFINDEYTIIEPNTFVGFYVPRGVTVRFPVIEQTPLKKFVEDYHLTGSTKYIDVDAIDEMIQSRTFNPRYGLSFSRKVYSESLGVKTKPRSAIRTVIFPKYNPKSIRLVELSNDEGIERLFSQGIVRSDDSDVYEFKRQYDAIPLDVPNYVRFVQLDFPNIFELRKRGFRL